MVRQMVAPSRPREAITSRVNIGIAASAPSVSCDVVVAADPAALYRNSRAAG